MWITAYGKSSSGSACGVITSYTGSKNINFWASYVNPASGTLTPRVNNTAIGTSSANSIAIPITFTSGQASFSFVYNDVGSIIINAKDNLTNNIGSTSPFVVRPAKFVITVPNNPGASNSTEGVFTKAGQPFVAQVQVQGNNGGVTPNYGNEIPAQGIELSSAALIAPSNGRNGSSGLGTIINGSSFIRTSPGNFQGSNFIFDEVGIIQLIASVDSGDYLGAGDVFGPQTGNIGRFIPNHFDITANTPSFNAGCVSGSFTYLDQPFLYSTTPVVTVAAKSALNTTTQNYTGSFWRLLTSSINPQYTSNAPTGVTLNSTLAQSSLSFIDNLNGTGTYTFGDGGGISFKRPSGSDPVVPFNAEIKLSMSATDQDGASYSANPFVIGGTTAGTGISFNGSKNILHGRILINNASGSELLALKLPLVAQYYTSSGFVTNVVDSCTNLINSSYVRLTTNPSNLSTTATLSGFSSGINTLTLSAPTGTKTGYVDLEVNLSNTGANIPWLQYDWAFDNNADKTYDDNPRARASFGSFKGNDKIIYQREIY